MPLTERRSGVLLHLTSLPGPHGVGDLGPEAYHFVDWLVSAGQRLWQVLPTTPIGPGDSPYQSVSAFAGSPLMVALEPLVAQGWLAAPALPEPGFDAQRVDYERVVPWRLEQLRRAWAGFAQRASARARADWAAWRAQHSPWLDDYTLFMALEAAHAGRPWWQWPQALAAREPRALALGPRRRRGARRVAVRRPVGRGEGLRQRPRGRAHGGPADLRGPPQRGLLVPPRSVRAGRAVPTPGGGRCAARRVQRRRPALGQPAVPLGPHGRGGLRVVDRATAPCDAAGRRVSGRPFSGLRGVLGGSGQQSDRGPGALGRGSRRGPVRGHRPHAGRLADRRRGPGRDHARRSRCATAWAFRGCGSCSSRSAGTPRTRICRTTSRWARSCTPAPTTTTPCGAGGSTARRASATLPRPTWPLRRTTSTGA